MEPSGVLPSTELLELCIAYNIKCVVEMREKFNEAFVLQYSQDMPKNKEAYELGLERGSLQGKIVQVSICKKQVKRSRSLLNLANTQSNCQMLL